MSEKEVNCKFIYKDLNSFNIIYSNIVLLLYEFNIIYSNIVNIIIPT